MSVQDLARLRAHLAQSDSRHLVFASHAPLADGVAAGVRAVASRGHQLAVVDLSSDGFLSRDLDTATWRQRVVGRVAVDGAFEDQLDRAVHLGLPAVWISLPDELDASRMRAVAEMLARSPAHVWLEVPWSEDGWERFDVARRFFAHHERVHVALDVTGEPPSDDVIGRWCAEPVEALIAEEPWPDLAPLFRSVLERVIVEGTGAEASLAAVHRSAWEGVPERERHAAGFSAHAIVPLEPLGDDLPSETYELIESCDVKYRAYRDALQSVLADRETALVAVVGAGRGGIVHEVLGAARLAECDARVLALEKNPGALRALHARNAREWNGAVEVVGGDMREWSPPAPLDVVASELLGGFGDNELSPECLAPVEKHLASDGVMIPSGYTSFVAPVHSAPLYMAVKDREHVHTVPLDRARLLASPSVCFSFEHPGEHAFEQDAAVSFVLEATGVVHGFAGFFEATLADGVTLSIHPLAHTPRMRSWEPVFFPLVEPLRLSAQDTLEARFFRRARRDRVWYEWVVLEPAVGRLHNAAGHAFAMRM